MNLNEKLKPLLKIYLLENDIPQPDEFWQWLEPKLGVKEHEYAQQFQPAPAKETISDSEMFYNQSVMNPYSGESQSQTAYKKGFYEAWQYLRAKEAISVPAQQGVEEEFKRYMSHAYFIGAIDGIGQRSGEEAFNA